VIRVFFSGFSVFFCIFPNFAITVCQNVLQRQFLMPF
jgi:hypothetical protein